MNAIIHFQAKLSKKLQPFVENGEPIEVCLGAVKDGEAQGHMRVVTKPGVTLEMLAAIGETSLIMRIANSEELVPDLETNNPVATLFTNKPNELQPSFPIAPPSSVTWSGSGSPIDNICLLYTSPSPRD